MSAAVVDANTFVVRMLALSKFLVRTFATKLRAAGIHEYDIADLLRRSTTSTERRDTKVTRGYSHAVPSRLREAVESICTLNVVEFRRKQA